MSSARTHETLAKTSIFGEKRLPINQQNNHYCNQLITKTKFVIQTYSFFKIFKICNRCEHDFGFGAKAYSFCMSSASTHETLAKTSIFGEKRLQINQQNNNYCNQLIMKTKFVIQTYSFFKMFKICNRCEHDLGFGAKCL